MADNVQSDPVGVNEGLSALDEARLDGAVLAQASNVVIAGLCRFASRELSRAAPAAPGAWAAACRAQTDGLNPRRHPRRPRRRTALLDLACLRRASSAGCTEPPLSAGLAGGGRLRRNPQ